MMPRPRTPTGKNETLCVKVSENDAGIIKARCAARGITPSEWLRSLIAADLSGVTDGGSVHGIALKVDPQMPEGTVALVSPGAPPVTFRAGAVDPKTCPHKGLAPGAYCRNCDTRVPERRKGGG
jgi:hypothetical protein